MDDGWVAHPCSCVSLERGAQSIQALSFSPPPQGGPVACRGARASASCLILVDTPGPVGETGGGRGRLDVQQAP